MNELELENEMFDDEIKKMRLENQLFAYKSQISDVKRKILELKKSERLFTEQQKELQVKIVEIEQQLK